MAATKHYVVIANFHGTFTRGDVVPGEQFVNAEASVKDGSLRLATADEIKLGKVAVHAVTAPKKGARTAAAATAPNTTAAAGSKKAGTAKKAPAAATTKSAPASAPTDGALNTPNTPEEGK